MLTDKNKKHNDMKNDIIEILQQHKLGHIPDEQALNELCVLFSVVWRSEPLSLICVNGYNEREHYCECKNKCLKCLE
jgi:hypothetical protein